MCRIACTFLMWKLTHKQIKFLSQENSAWIHCSPNYLCINKDLIEDIEIYQGYDFSKVQPLFIELTIKDNQTILVCKKKLYSTKLGIEFTLWIEKFFDITPRRFHNITRLYVRKLNFNEFDYIDLPRKQKNQQIFILLTSNDNNAKSSSWLKIGLCFMQSPFFCVRYNISIINIFNYSYIFLFLIFL